MSDLPQIATNECIDRAVRGPSDVETSVREVASAIVELVDAVSRISMDDAPICAICYDVLSSKRIATLECKHSFHRTCVMQWFESRERLDRSCCTCRAESANVIDEYGVTIPETYPFESRTYHLFETDYAFFLFNGSKRDIDFISDGLTQQRIMALRDGKSAEFIADIDEEMEKYERRSDALFDCVLNWLVRGSRVQEDRDAARAAADAERAASYAAERAAAAAARAAEEDAAYAEVRAVANRRRRDRRRMADAEAAAIGASIQQRRR